MRCCPVGPIEAHVHAVCLLCIHGDHHGQGDPCQFVTLTCEEFEEVCALV